MKQMCIAVCLTFLAGCGGSPSNYIATPQASAQVPILTNFTAVNGPWNIVNSTNGVSSVYIAYVKANTPVAGQATFKVFATLPYLPGNTVTISSTFPAITTNNGVYTILSVDLPTTTFVVNCSGCVDYTDQEGYYNDSTAPPWGCAPFPCPANDDGFPALVTNNGVLHLFYVQGTGDQTLNPHHINWMTSTDGITFTQPTTIFTDPTTTCTNGFGGAAPCSYWSVSAGTTPNGNVIAFANLQNSGPVSYKGLFWKIYSGSWSPAYQLPDPAPDGSNWWAMYGQILQFGTMACSGQFYSVNLNVYFGCTCDNGLTWGQASCNGGFRPITPAPPQMEGVVLSAGGTKLVGIFRTNLTLTLSSCNGGPPCGTWYIYKSPDMGVTWSRAVSGTGSVTATTVWELVAPTVVCPSATGCILLWGERDIIYPTTMDRMLWTSFDPIALYNDPTMLGIPRQIASNIVNPADCCYGSISTMPNDPTKVFIAWYWDPNSSKNWKLYTTTASYGASADTAMTGALTGAIQ